MIPPQIRIDIWLDGKIYGARHWPAVPRKGDLIFLNRKRGDAQAMEKDRVMDVVWGAAPDDVLGPTVAIECAWKSAT